MIKKAIKVFIYTAILFSVLFAIYKNPEILFETETQTKLIETADKLDSALDDAFTGSIFESTSSGVTNTGILNVE